MATANEFTLEWFPAISTKPAIAVALVVHGLNVYPCRMSPIIQLLTENGVDAFNLALHGHGGNYSEHPGLSLEDARLESFRQVSYRLWRDEFHAAYTEATIRAEHIGHVPIYLIGYSLGGLIGCDSFADSPDVDFAKMVLFAPALKIRPVSYVLRPLSPFPRIIIPSASPEGYRCNRGTSMAAYNALYIAVDHFDRNVGRKLNIPTLVFLDKKDELVSYSETRKLIDYAGLTRWRLYTVEKDKTAEQRYRHLIIDASSVGQAMWEKITATIISHLLG